MRKKTTRKAQKELDRYSEGKHREERSKRKSIERRMVER